MNVREHITTTGNSVNMKILLTTMVGLEETTLKHVERDFGLRGEKIRNGRVLVDGSYEDAVRLVYAGRTFERVMILLGIFENVYSLDDVYRAVRSIDFQEFMGPDRTFACRSDRMGDHPFTSLDIERAAGQAVVDYFLEVSGKRIRANLRDPDVVVRADLDGSALYVALDLVGYEALHRRGYRKYNHPAALNASLASSMLLESGWDADKSLLDPFAGGGTIPIEAALWARKVPWFRYRTFIFERNNIIDPDILRDVKEDLLAAVNRRSISATGVELFQKHINGALENAKSAGVLDTITFLQGDAAKIELSADVIVTNPPYGNRIANPRVVRKLYYEFADRAAENQVRTVLVITSRWKWMESALETAGYTVEKSKFVLYGKLHTHMIRAKL